MVKAFFIRVLYRLFFTILFACLSGVGAENLIAYYVAVATGLFIDLLRYKFVSDELSGVKEESFKEGWAFKKTGPLNKSLGSYIKITFYLILCIWIICILDWLIPSQIMDFYFNLFTPFYGILASQVDIIRDHPVQLIEAGYANRVPLTLHIYTVAFLGSLSILVYHCCFKVNKLMYPWDPSVDKENDKDPLTYSKVLIYSVVFVFAIWIVWLKNTPIEFIPKRKYSYAIHVSNIGFVLHTGLMIISLNAVLAISFQYLIRAYHRLSHKN